MMSAAGNIEYVDLKRSIYREYSRSYDEDRRHFVSGVALAQRIDWALEGLGPGLRLLDLGCGSGELLSAAAARTGGDGLSVGMDLTPEMLALARSRIGRAVGLLEGNVLQGLPFGDRSFHRITSLNLVQELPTGYIPSFLAEVYRVLMLGGAFRAVIPCLLDDNPSSRAFGEMANQRGAMSFLPAVELAKQLERVSFFIDRQIHIVPSPAASAAASGKTRFRLFTWILAEIESMGLDAAQVQQGVIFFSARRRA